MISRAQELPLKDIRVVTVEQYGAGPFGSMYLADLGAEVIKIENPKVGGDVSRKTGPYFLGENDSSFFQTFNLNKKSMTLDLKSDSGKGIFHQLVKSADAVMNNLRGDQPEKLGLTYQQLRSINPKICCAHLSAYGRDNDRKEWPGYDYLMQAEAGYMNLTGEPNGPPVRMGLSIVDFMTGVTTALGLTAALFSAYKSGKGRDIDVSLFDVALHQLSYPASWYLNHQHNTTRLERSAHPSTVPCQLYKTKDSWIFVMAMTEKFWLTLLEILQCSELEDMRFADVKLRRENREALTKVLDNIFSSKKTEFWLSKLYGKLPVAPVYDLQQSLQNPYLNMIQMVQSISHHPAGQLSVLSNPIKINGERIEAKACSGLGENTIEILQELGYSTQAINELKQAGCV